MQRVTTTVGCVCSFSCKSFFSFGTQQQDPLPCSAARATAAETEAAAAADMTKISGAVADIAAAWWETTAPHMSLWCCFELCFLTQFFDWLLNFKIFFTHIQHISLLPPLRGAGANGNDAFACTGNMMMIDVS